MLGVELNETVCGVESGSSRSTIYVKGEFLGWPEYFPVAGKSRRWGFLGGRSSKRERERENCDVCVF